MNKIIDSFLFLNEFEILDIRLSMLQDYVEKFVILEHNIDFNNQKKEYNLEKNIDYFHKKYKNKIEYIKIDSVEISGKWEQEIYQKNNLNICFDMYPDAYFLFGDLDEVPDPRILKNIIEEYEKNGPCLFFLNWIINRWDNVLEKEWPGPVFGKKEDVAKKGGVRNFMCPGGSKSSHWNKEYYHSIKNSGWHWSYFGNVDSLSTKLNSVIEGKKVRRKIRDEEQVIRNGELFQFIKKYSDSDLKKIQKGFYPDFVFRLISKYPEWWNNFNIGD